MIVLNLSSFVFMVVIIFDAIRSDRGSLRSRIREALEGVGGSRRHRKGLKGGRKGPQHFQRQVDEEDGGAVEVELTDIYERQSRVDGLNPNHGLGSPHHDVPDSEARRPERPSSSRAIELEREMSRRGEWAWRGWCKAKWGCRGGVLWERGQAACRLWRDGWSSAQCEPRTLLPPPSAAAALVMFTPIQGSLVVA